jgi:hypothetical protein
MRSRTVGVVLGRAWASVKPVLPFDERPGVDT